MSAVAALGAFRPPAPMARVGRARPARRPHHGPRGRRFRRRPPDRGRASPLREASHAVPRFGVLANDPRFDAKRARRGRTIARGQPDVSVHGRVRRRDRESECPLGGRRAPPAHTGEHEGVERRDRERAAAGGGRRGDDRPEREPRSPPSSRIDDRVPAEDLGRRARAAPPGVAPAPDEPQLHGAAAGRRYRQVGHRGRQLEREQRLLRGPQGPARRASSTCSSICGAASATWAGSSSTCTGSRGSRSTSRTSSPGERKTAELDAARARRPAAVRAGRAHRWRRARRSGAGAFRDRRSRRSLDVAGRRRRPLGDGARARAPDRCSAPLVGVVTTVVTAIALSPRFPIGSGPALRPRCRCARRLARDRNRRRRAGASPILASAWIAAEWRFVRGERAARRGPPRRGTGRPGSGCRPRWRSDRGLRIEPGRGKRAVPVRSALTGAIVGVIGIVACFTFRAGILDAQSTPARSGIVFDDEVGRRRRALLAGRARAPRHTTTRSPPRCEAAWARNVLIDGKATPTFGTSPLVGNLPLVVLSRARPAWPRRDRDRAGDDEEPRARRRRPREGRTLRRDAPRANRR